MEGLYYLCSENKGADQLCGYCEADLRLCFRICKMMFFSWHGSYAKCGDGPPESQTLVSTQYRCMIEEETLK